MSSAASPVASHLYLDGSRARCAVSLEGAALRISDGRGADRLLPLRRIDRVSATGDVWWQSAAVSALAQSGAPLGILDGEGRLKALLMPCNIRRSSLKDLLDRLTNHPDWPDRIEDWRRSEVSIHARALGIDDPSHAARMGWSGAETIVRQAAQPLSRARAHRLANEARSFAQLFAQRVLRDRGCPASWLGADPDPVHDLSPVFAQIVLWRLARRVVTSRGRSALRRALDRDCRQRRRAGPALAATAEAAGAGLRRALAGDLDRFYRCFLEFTSANHVSGGR